MVVVPTNAPRLVGYDTGMTGARVAASAAPSISRLASRNLVPKNGGEPPDCVLLADVGTTTLPFKGWLSRFGICAILLNLIKSDVLGVAGNFTALRGYYYIINW